MPHEAPGPRTAQFFYRRAGGPRGGAAAPPWGGGRPLVGVQNEAVDPARAGGAFPGAHAPDGPRPARAPPPAAVGGGRRPAAPAPPPPVQLDDGDLGGGG